MWLTSQVIEKSSALLAVVSGYLQRMTSSQHRAMTTLHLWLSLVVGMAVHVYVLIGWVQTRESFSLQGAFANLPIGPFRNPLYRGNQLSAEEHRKAAERQKDLEAELKSIEATNKELNARANSALQDVKRRDATIQELTMQLKTLTEQGEQSQTMSAILTYAIREVYRMLGISMAVARSGESLTYEQEFHELMKEFANAIKKVTLDNKADKSSSIMIINPACNYMEIVGSNGLEHASLARTFERGQGFAGSVWETKAPQICGDVLSDRRFRQEGCSPTGPYRSIIGIPILDHSNDIVGAFFVQCHRVDSFALDEDILLLSPFARLLALALVEYRSIKWDYSFSAAESAAVGGDSVHATDTTP